jgi:hypothetical protein
MRHEKEFNERLEYMHLNPVPKGLGIGIRGSRIGVSSQLSPPHPLLLITEN